MQTAELHIASLVVHVVPAQLAEVLEALSRMRGACLHGSTPQGKSVVTLEEPSAEAMTAAVTSIQQMRGVLSAALVYQCSDTLEAMNEEIPDAQA
jgi:nitrate reductase NapD